MSTPTPSTLLTPAQCLVALKAQTPPENTATLAVPPIPLSPLPPGDSTIAEMIRRLTQTPIVPEPIEFHLVLVPEAEEATVESFGDALTVASRLRELLDTETQVFVFAGKRWGVTTGKQKFLTDPTLTQKIPIFFDAQAPLEIDPSGHLN